MGSPDRIVVFVHGLWLHADSWTPWVERLRRAGYSPTAPGWPGDRRRRWRRRARNAEAVAGYGIDDVVDHYARIIRRSPAKPIVIGHSFGGLIAQRLSAETSPPPRSRSTRRRSRASSTCRPRRSASRRSRCATPATATARSSLTEEQFRYGFGNAAHRGGVEGAVRAVGDPVAGQAAVRGRVGEPHRRAPPAKVEHATTRRAARCSSPPAARTTPSRHRSATRR